MDEPIEYIRDGEDVYGVFENPDGSTYTELIGVCEEEDDGGYYVDVSGEFGGCEEDYN